MVLKIFVYEFITLKKFITKYKLDLDISNEEKELIKLINTMYASIFYLEEARQMILSVTAPQEINLGNLTFKFPEYSIKDFIAKNKKLFL